MERIRQHGEARALVDVRNEADQMIYQTESLLEEHKDAISEGNRGEIEGA